MALQTGVASLPLHGGKCPKWLFPRMVKMSKAISEIIVYEHGQQEFLRRIADPYFFQSFSCIVGFDWHSSGTTTTLCGALKEALNKNNIGIKIAGGKGKTSLKTPDEIEKSNLSSEKIENLKYSSKIVAKVDNNLIQDNYNLYHHCIFFDEKGNWAVVQQGMNNINNFARRYHWLNSSVKEYVEEPHTGICCDKKESKVLDLTSKQSKETRSMSLDLVNDNPEHLKKYINFSKNIQVLNMPSHHHIIDMRKIEFETLMKAYEFQPENYEELVSLKGVGAKTLRSLALISELIYGTKSSWQDPSKFSFAHGGKDKIPYPVNRQLMDENSMFLRNALQEAKIESKDKIIAMRKLNSYLSY